MVIYNVTVGVDLDIEMEWLQWMINEHAPKLVETGYFNSFDVFKVLSHQDEGASYSIQYKSDSLDKVEKYLAEEAPALMKEHMNKYRNKHVAFRTLLEKVG